MRWRQLEAFQGTMLAGTVSGAAEILGVSQPAVSRLIDALETSIELTLFDRISGRLVPTAEAYLFYQDVQKAFVSLDKLKTTVNDIKFGKTGNLHIVSMPAMGLEFMPKAIAEFSTLYPNVLLRHDIHLSPRVENWASSQQINLGISEYPAQHYGFEIEEFCKIPYLLVLPKGHPLCAKLIINPVDLIDIPIISCTKEATVRHIIDRIFRDAGVDQKIVCETPFAHGVCTFVCNKMGVGIVDPFTAVHFGNSDVVFRKFEPVIEFHVGLLIPSHKPISKTTNKFLSILRKHRKELLSRIDSLYDHLPLA